MATQLSRKRAVEEPTIPDRLYFKIGDVARICGLETYVLRFWETQFPQLKPNKSGTGQRLYRRREVELVLDIKRLVHKEGYTLAGARHALEQHGRRRGPQAAKPEPAPAPPANSPKLVQEADRRRDAVAATIGHVRAELREIVGLLTHAAPAIPPAPRPVRRRARLAPVPDPYNSLFPT